VTPVVATGTSAYLIAQPDWRLDHGPVLDRRTRGVVDRISVTPISDVPLNVALDWAVGHAESVYLSLDTWGRPPWFVLHGTPADDTRAIDLDNLQDAADTIEDQRESEGDQVGEYFRRREGSWLKDLRTQRGFSRGELARRSGASVSDLDSFEETGGNLGGPPTSPPLVPTQLGWLVRVAHVLAGIALPSEAEVDAALHSVRGPGHALMFAIQAMVKLHPEARLPPSSVASTPRPELLKAVVAEVTPVLTELGYKRSKNWFSKELDSLTVASVQLRGLGKGHPPSSWQKKGWSPRESRGFAVDIYVSYRYPDDPQGPWQPDEPAYNFRGSVTSLEPPLHLGVASEWSLDDPESVVATIAAELVASDADYVAKRSVARVLAAMEKPFWFEVLDDRLAACRLACVQEDRERAQLLFDWACLEQGLTPLWLTTDRKMTDWMVGKYGLTAPSS